MQSKSNFPISSKIPIVFVPALMGTTLVNDDNINVYVTAATGMGLDTPNLKLPIKWNCNDGDVLPVQEKDDIRPSKPLKSIKLGPIKILNQYSTFCKHFEQYDNFHSFAYDWRRDLNETTNMLLEFLEYIKRRYGVSAQVISHSMGCLVAVAAYNINPELFHSTLFCGGNFAGGFGFYPTNTEGMNVGLNKTYLGPDVVHTFPSMYATASPMGVGKDPVLRNRKGRQLWQFVDAKDTKKNVDIDMWNVQDWKRYKIGPWISNATIPLEMEEHVQICLELGHTFQMKMRNLEQKDGIYVEKTLKDVCMYPPVAVLVGDQFLHPEDFLWDTKESRMIEWTPTLMKKLKPRNFARTDGTVSYMSASQPPIPKGVKVRNYSARNNGPALGAHRDLINDVEMIEHILRDLKRDAASIRL
jgi:pimeloyl-ACP methyl ester carboxylesterase